MASLQCPVLWSCFSTGPVDLSVSSVLIEAECRSGGRSCGSLTMPRSPWLLYLHHARLAMPSPLPPTHFLCWPHGRRASLPFAHLSISSESPSNVLHLPIPYIHCSPPRPAPLFIVLPLVPHTTQLMTALSISSLNMYIYGHNDICSLSCPTCLFHSLVHSRFSMNWIKWDISHNVTYNLTWAYY